MAYKSFKPYTPGRRQMTVSTFEEIQQIPQKNPFWLLFTIMAVVMAPVRPPFVTRAADINVSTELSISREIKMAFRLKSQPSNTIQIVPAASHCCSMQMVKNATSSLRKV